MPKEDQPLGPPRALARILQAVWAQADRLHQGEPSRDVADGRMVGCHLLSLVCHQLDQHHICPPAEEVVVARATGRTYDDRVAHHHVQHRDRIAGS